MNRFAPLPKPTRYVGDWVVIINKKDPTIVKCALVEEIFMGSLKLRVYEEGCSFTPKAEYWEIV